MKISSLEISAKNFQEQLQFYQEGLGLPVQRISDEAFQVLIGFSVLKFQYKPDATPYHIAFHIPVKQEDVALQWLKERVEIQAFKDDEIIDFSNWKAKSIYFYDADKNILELISRSDLYPPKVNRFSAESLIGIAEIGMATEAIQPKFKFLQEQFGLEVYDGNFDKFCAVGDDEGLVIVIDQRKKDWFPTNDKAFVSGFKIEFQHQKKFYNFGFNMNKVFLV